MDRRFSSKDQVYLDTHGHALNLAVNELTDVLHTFYLNVVAEEDSPRVSPSDGVTSGRTQGPKPQSRST
jgi:hypothetical protein